MTAFIEMAEVTKRYGDFLANDRINFLVRGGELHALLGENGAGKTTLMRVLSGFTLPDSGQIRMNAEPIRIRSPADAIRIGIGMVHQHWRLVERFTVLENLALGNPAASDRATFRKKVDALCQRFGLKVRLNAPVWQLSLGERQRVEILRVMQRGATILILDEPTAVLAPQERDQLFSTLHEMVSGGTAVILISHKLGDVVRHCDRVTVMRQGRIVGQREGATATAAELAELMVGRSLRQNPFRRSGLKGPVALELVNVEARTQDGRISLRGLNLTLCSGEVLGVAGVSGNGQKELAEVCAGLRQPSHGCVRLQGRGIGKMPPEELRRAGLSFIPEDRMGSGVCPDMSVAENLILRNPGRPDIASFGFLKWPAIERFTFDCAKRFDVRLSSAWTPVRWLSGGNIQKVILARELGQSPSILVAAQPTRGLDVAATEFVHDMLLAMRARGTAILLVSDDLDEILKLSDRLMVLYDGAVAGEFSPDSSRHEIGLAMTGVNNVGSRSRASSVIGARTLPQIYP
jgi:general nucleoside transport system ATP-binding protein